MTIFTKIDQTIEASRKRVTALWFGDVDRISMADGSHLTGTAVMASIFTLAGKYQYFIVFYSLSNRIIETWRISPENTSISGSAEMERNIMASLKDRNIELSPIPSDSGSFNKALMRLPLSFDDDNSTRPADNFFNTPGSQHDGVSLSNNEKEFLRKLIICQ